MKKAFSTLISVIILMLFSALIVFVFEIKAIQNENIKNEYLQIQAKLHLDFLNEYVKTLNDNSIKTLEFANNHFSLKIESTTNSFELFVIANQHNISLHKSVIK